MTFRNCQTDHLMKIPPKMVDRAERQSSSCLTLQKGLQLLSGDAVQLSLAKFQGDMEVDAIFDSHSGRALPPPAMNHEVHVVNKILQQHLGVERDLAAVDGPYMFGDLVHRVGLCHLCDAAENNISPMSVFPPLAYPSTVPFLDAAFLKPSTHESNLLSCVHGVDIGFGGQCSTRTVILNFKFPSLQCRPPYELLT